MVAVSSVGCHPINCIGDNPLYAPVLRSGKELKEHVVSPYGLNILCATIARVRYVTNVALCGKCGATKLKYYIAILHIWPSWAHKHRKLSKFYSLLPIKWLKAYANMESVSQFALHFSQILHEHMWIPQVCHLSEKKDQVVTGQREWTKGTIYSSECIVPRSDLKP